MDLEFENLINNKIIIFNTNKYLNKIGLSYQYSPTQIKSQFFIDFHRSRISLNNKLVNLSDLLEKLSEYSDYNIFIYRNKLNLDIFIKMLLTQAIFELPFSIMSKYYTRPEIGQHVISNKIEIFLNISKKMINIKPIAHFDVINIEKNQKLFKIDIIIDLDLELLKKNANLYKYAILTWNIY